MEDLSAHKFEATPDTNLVEASAYIASLFRDQVQESLDCCSERLHRHIPQQDVLDALSQIHDTYGPEVSIPVALRATLDGGIIRLVQEQELI